ncbi:MAG TPA: hypothetical protein VIY28_10580 [Pseudonocardiaceae bacterium]
MPLCYPLGPTVDGRRARRELGDLGMARKRSPLPVQVLLFLLATLLGAATNNLTDSTGALPLGLELLRRQSLPLAGITVLLIIGVMVWQHRTEERLASPTRPVWDSDRSPFPGLEAFTERDQPCHSRWPPMPAEVMPCRCSHTRYRSCAWPPGRVGR